MKYREIINEWFAHLPKGYAFPPYTQQEEEVLHQVLQKYNISILELNEAVESEKSTTDDQEIISKIQQLGLSNDVKKSIIRTYMQLSDLEKTNFKKYFRQSSLDQYVKNTHQYFKPFTSIVPSDTSRGGMGKGEVSIILGVKDSESGGTGAHDILIGGDAWEVKQLVKGKFDPAKDGSVHRFPITQKILTFYNDIVFPLQEIDDPFNEIKSIFNEKGHGVLKQILDVIDSNFQESIESENLLFKYEWKISAFINWYEGFTQLNQLLKKQGIVNNVTDTRVTVASGGSNKSFWISDDDADDIERGSQNEEPVSIVVGQPVESDNKKYILWFKLLERNELVNNPKSFIDGLTQIKQTFFNGIAGLIWFDSNFNPHESHGEDFAVSNASQSRYRFVLKNHSSASGKKYIQDQE